MESSRICWRCTRALQRAQSSSQLNHHPRPQSFSTYTTQWQKQAQPISSSTLPSDIPAPLTSPSDPNASTSNPSASSSANAPSTRHMQQAIQTTLSRPAPDSMIVSLARTLRRAAPAATDNYVVYGRTQTLFNSCAAQAPYTIPEAQRTKILTGEGPRKTPQGEDIGIPEAASAAAEAAGSSIPTATPPDNFWHHSLSLLPTFSTWSQVTYLHMYLVHLSLRSLTPTTSHLRSHHQFLLEHFSHAAEDKMVLLHSINSRSIRNQYLKDLFLQWRGVIAAYDEGFVRGDAMLASAVWRNLFKGDESADWEKVSAVVAYMRRAAGRLGQVKRLDGQEGLAAVLHEEEGGAWGKEGLWEVVRRESRGVKEV